LRKWWMVL